MYDADLAYIHHVAFGDFARDAAPGVLSTLRRGGVTSGRVVDLGCGSGIWARRLTDARYQVTGIDVSPAMIALACRTAPQADLRVGSIHRTSIPPCDAITALGEGLNYRTASGRSSPSLSGLFRRVYAALRPGGMFVFDAIVTPLAPSIVGSRCRAESNWAVLTEVASSRNGRQLRRRITVFRKIGRSYRRSDETHVVDVLDRRDLELHLRHVGFTVRTVRRYGDMALLPSRRAFVARKRGPR